MQKLPMKPTFYEMYIDYQTDFKNEYGREKFKKIFDTVTNSNTIRELISKAQSLNVAPSGRDYTTCILSMSYFIFAKSDTRLMGSIIALYMWDQQVNVYFQYKDIKAMYYTVEDIFGNLGMY